MRRLFDTTIRLFCLAGAKAYALTIAEMSGLRKCLLNNKPLGEY
jgi:hypothetical protein